MKSNTSQKIWGSPPPPPGPNGTTPLGPLSFLSEFQSVAVFRRTGRKRLVFLYLENILCLNVDFLPKWCDEPKKFSFPKVGRRSRFYPAHARNYRFRMCLVQNSGTFQKHHFGSNYSTRLRIENFGSKRLILVLDLEQIVSI